MAPAVRADITGAQLLWLGGRLGKAPELEIPQLVGLQPATDRGAVAFAFMPAEWHWPDRLVSDQGEAIPEADFAGMKQAVGVRAG